MQSKAIPDDLLALREQIDLLDDELVSVLARRFAVTDQVGRLKARERLESVDPEREREKLIRLKARAESESLNGDFVIELFQLIFAEVVKNHHNFRNG